MCRQRWRIHFSKLLVSQTKVKLDAVQILFSCPTAFTFLQKPVESSRTACQQAGIRTFALHFLIYASIYHLSRHPKLYLLSIFLLFQLFIVISVTIFRLQGECCFSFVIIQIKQFRSERVRTEKRKDTAKSSTAQIMDRHVTGRNTVAWTDGTPKQNMGKTGNLLLVTNDR